MIQRRGYVISLKTFLWCFSHRLWKRHKEGKRRCNLRKMRRTYSLLSVLLINLLSSCLCQDKLKRAELELEEEKSSVEMMTDRVARTRDQIDQLRSELMQERSSKQDLELDKNAMERHVRTHSCLCLLTFVIINTWSYDQKFNQTECHFLSLYFIETQNTDFRC